MLRLSRKQVREVDRIAIEEYGIPGIVLMENAARSAVEAIRLRFPTVHEMAIAIVCGPGNNGGDGYAIARHLHNLGSMVMVVETDDKPAGDGLVNHLIAIKMGIERETVWDRSYVGGIDLVVDALFGTGLTRPLLSPTRTSVLEMNDSGLPIVAIDIPSGLDCDTGEPLGDACVKADLTVTFVAEKLGFANPKSRHYTGEIVVGDIGCPREIIDRVLREVPVS